MYTFLVPSISVPGLLASKLLKTADGRSRSEMNTFGADHNNCGWEQHCPYAMLFLNNHIA